MSTLRSILFLFTLGMVMCGAMNAETGYKNRRPSTKYSNSISLQIEPAGWGKNEPHVYPLKKTISIRCMIRNFSKKPVQFSLKDHDAYHGTLPYPIEASVRIEQDNGMVITANEIDKSGKGWWSQYYLWSTTFDPSMPGDTILIPPGGVVVRHVPIDQVISMAPGAKGGLPEGAYSVQVRINGIISNPIKIQVGPAE